MNKKIVFLEIFGEMRTENVMTQALGALYRGQRAAQVLRHAMGSVAIVLAGGLLWQPSFAQQQANPQAPTAAPAPAPAAPVLGSLEKPKGEEYVVSKRVGTGATLGRLVFYRPQTSVDPGVSSIRVNSNYHTSLQSGGFADLCMQPGRVAITAQRVETKKALAVDLPQPMMVELSNAQETYLRIVDQGTSAQVMTLVSAEVALEELKQTRRQIHTISRVPGAVVCELDDVKAAVVAPPKAVEPQVEVISLPADSIFVFGKSDISNYVPNGRRELDTVIANLKAKLEKSNLSQLLITGHSDPLGSVERKKIIAEDRARSVRDYLIQGGIPANKITSVGRSDSELLVRNCGLEVNPINIECNQRNRRVVLSVSLQSK